MAKKNKKCHDCDNFPPMDNLCSISGVKINPGYTNCSRYVNVKEDDPVKTIELNPECRKCGLIAICKHTERISRLYTEHLQKTKSLSSIIQVDMVTSCGWRQEAGEEVVEYEFTDWEELGEI